MIPKKLYDKTKGLYYDTDPHQIEAYEHLAARDRAALFLEMSLSKTVIILSLLHYLHYQDCAITKTLVVAPDKVARITWPEEINKWGHLEGTRYSVISGTPKQRLKALNADAEIFIIGVDNLAWLIDQYIYKRKSRVTGRPYGPWLGSLPFDCIVLDELSLFKESESIRFTKLARAIKTIQYRYGLTGTPTPNGLIDLWAELFLLDDGERLGETKGQYIDKYLKIRGNGMIVYEYIPRIGAPTIIAEKIRDIALTMRADDYEYINLPKVHTVDERLDFDDNAQNSYDQLEREYVLDFFSGQSVTVKTPADLTNKLLQVSSGAMYEEQAYDDSGKKLPRVWHELNTAKIDALGALLDKHPKENFIVVYQFRHEIERIKAAFPFAREFRKGAKLTEDFKDWNDGKIRLLLIHPAGAGHGLNLQFGGRRMVFFTLTWNLEHYLQTIARLRRRGGAAEMYVYRFIVNGTRDLRVRRKVEGKENDQTFFMNEITYYRNKYNISA